MDEYLIVDTVTGTVLAPEGCKMVHAHRITDDVLSDESLLVALAEKHGMTLPAYFDRPDDY